MESLILHGADKHVNGKLSNTVLHLCWGDDLSRAVEFLGFYTKQGGELDCMNNAGNSPLMTSLLGNCTEINENWKAGKEEEVEQITAFFVKCKSTLCCKPNKKENLPVHIAAKIGNVKTMKILLKRGCNPFYRNKDGNTPLHEALISAPQKILKVVSTLLKGNSLYFGLNHSGKSLLYLGTTIPRHNSYYLNSQDKQICSKVVQMLLDYGENPNTHLAYFIPLISAIKEEDLTTVDILVKAGADVNALNEDGQTCLHILFARNVVTVINCKKRLKRDYGRDNKKEIISKLILVGANVNIVDASGKTALSMFCEKGSNIDIGELLLNAGAEPSNKDYCIQNVMQNNIKTSNDIKWINFTQKLLQKGADPNMFENWKPNVVEATKKGCKLLVEEMIKCGTDINVCDSINRSALYHACGLEKAKDRDEIVRLLVQNGSKLNTLSTNGDKAIDILLEKILEDTMPGWSPDYDMQLFNFLIRAGSDLCPFVLPERQEESFAQRIDGTSTNRSTLLTLINNGLFKSAEYLIQCGWETEREVWFNDFDVSNVDLSEFDVGFKKGEKRNIGEVKSEFKAFLDSLEVGPKSLSVICRKNIRQQLLVALDDTEIESRVKVLPIPEKVQAFLCLKGFAQDREVLSWESTRKRSMRRQPAMETYVRAMFFPPQQHTSRRNSSTFFERDYDTYNNRMMEDEYPVQTSPFYYDFDSN